MNEKSADFECEMFRNTKKQEICNQQIAQRLFFLSFSGER